MDKKKKKPVAPLSHRTGINYFRNITSYSNDRSTRAMTRYAYRGNLINYNNIIPHMIKV